jgi:hypothetical protein
MEHHLVITSIIEELTKSPIYVDNLAEPQTAVTWNNRRIYLVGHSVGDMPTGIHRLLETEVVPSLQSRGFIEIIVYFAPASWEQELRKFFGQSRAETVLRCYYSTSDQVPESEVLIPKGARLEFIKRDLRESELRNLDMVIDEIESEGSIENFLQR